MADHAIATITNPSAALTDFTLIVDLSRMPTDWWTAVDTTDGTRGRVYKGDGTTRLPADWIDFDDTAETGLLRVLWSGTLATTGTQQLWIEPPVSGNAAVLATDTYGSDNAYDANWLIYAPLIGDANDRTVNNRDGTVTGATADGASGYVFDGVDDFIDFGTSPFGGLAAMTMMVDVLPDARGDMISEDGQFAGNDSFYLATDTGPTEARITESTATTTYDVKRWGTDISLSAYTHIAFSWESGSEIQLYQEGTAGGARVYDAATQTGVLRVGDRPLTVGGRPVGSPVTSVDLDYDGHIRHYQGHSVARNSSWIALEADQTRDQATFWGTWTWTTTGGGTTFSVSVSDGISLSDSPSGALTITASVSDGLTLSDSPTGPLRISASVADGVSFADSSGGTATIPVNVADSIVLSDTVLGAFTFGVQVSDGVTLSDQATEGGVISVSVSDGITFSDSASAVLRILQTISDGVVFSDEASAVATIRATVSDGVTFSDAVTTALRVVASVSDGVKLSDVAIDSTFLPVGRVQITVTTKQASVTITAKQPSVAVTFI